MSGSLRCYSFHSVKGGVGKSTLSVLTALGLAQHHGARVTLVDMDLTGTSLADVLPLEAPAWEGVEPPEPLNLVQPPSAFLSLERSREWMQQRDKLTRKALDAWMEAPEDEAADESFSAQRRAIASYGVPFLNDYLLFATPDWDELRDVHPRALFWRLRGMDSERLRIIPSSALPADLERTVPLVFDESHSGFLEGRLEYLLDALVPDEGEHIVVVDTPPTIPGLSRTMLSLALRLSQQPKLPLSEDGGMPRRLADARVDWTAFLVGTMDHQDIRAANRWLARVLPEEQPHVRFLVNRVPQGDELQLQDMLGKVIERERNALLDDARFVREERGLSFFRSSEIPPIPEAALSFLWEDGE